MTYRDDDDAQVDGDHSGPVRFQSRLAAAGQPWLRSGLPPWHMWGNTQVLTTLQTGGSFTASTPDTQELVRVAYKRPERWRWVFQAKLLDIPAPPIPATFSRLDVFFDVTIGHGRAMVQMPAFETLTWFFRNNGVPPTLTIGSVLRSTEGRAFRTYSDEGGAITTVPTVQTDLVAQDIQVQARLVLTTSGSGFTGSAEVSAFFAPAAHVRPDWFADGPLEVQYPGGETGGK